MLLKLDANQLKLEESGSCDPAAPGEDDDVCGGLFPSVGQTSVSPPISFSNQCELLPSNYSCALS